MSRVFTGEEEYSQPNVLLIPGGSSPYIIHLTGQTRQTNNFTLTASHLTPHILPSVSSGQKESQHHSGAIKDRVQVPIMQRAVQARYNAKCGE